MGRDFFVNAKFTSPPKENPLYTPLTKTNQGKPNKYWRPNKYARPKTAKKFRYRKIRKHVVQFVFNAN